MSDFTGHDVRTVGRRARLAPVVRINPFASHQNKDSARRSSAVGWRRIEVCSRRVSKLRQLVSAISSVLVGPRGRPTVVCQIRGIVRQEGLPHKPAGSIGTTDRLFQSRHSQTSNSFRPEHEHQCLRLRPPRIFLPVTAFVVMPKTPRKPVPAADAVQLPAALRRDAARRRRAVCRL